MRKYFLEPLAGISGYKPRIGDYRAIIGLDKPGKVIDVLLVGHRKNIYDRMD